MEILQRRATSENKFVKWRILQSASCDHCNGEAENVLHALWKCSAISQVWRSVPEINFSPLRNFTTISDLILQAQNDGKDVEKLTMVVWTIWHWRNQIRAKNENYPISQVVLNTIQALQVLEILEDCIVFLDEKIYISALYRRHKCAVQVKCSTSISVLYK